MFLEQLDAVKWYLDSHLAKRFIQASLACYSLLILFVKKLEERIRFCVDYKKLNAIIKKDCYGFIKSQYYFRLGSTNIFLLYKIIFWVL